MPKHFLPGLTSLPWHEVCDGCCDNKVRMLMLMLLLMLMLMLLMLLALLTLLTLLMLTSCCCGNTGHRRAVPRLVRRRPGREDGPDRAPPGHAGRGSQVKNIDL